MSGKVAKLSNKAVYSMYVVDAGSFSRVHPALDTGFKGDRH